MRRWLCWFLLCLTALAQEPEVKVTTLLEGFGPPAAYGNTLAISYELRLIADGEIVDGTLDGQPYPLTLGSPTVLRGMTQGLVGARRGETREVVIPPSWGYGDRAAGPIPANSTLYFKVKVLAITREDHDHDGDGSPDHSAHEHEHVNHDHDGDGKPDHAAHEHSESGEGFENRPHAGNLSSPALFEYLLRDFFTRPWRYDDAAQSIWKANGWLTLAILVVWAVLTALARRRGEQS